MLNVSRNSLLFRTQCTQCISSSPLQVCTHYCLWICIYIDYDLNHTRPIKFYEIILPVGHFSCLTVRENLFYFTKRPLITLPTPWQGLILEHYLHPVPFSIYLENADLSNLPIAMCRIYAEQIHLSAVIENKLPSQTQLKHHARNNQSIFLDLIFLAVKSQSFWRMTGLWVHPRTPMSYPCDQQSSPEPTWAWMEDVNHTVTRPGIISTGLVRNLLLIPVSESTIAMAMPDFAAVLVKC